MPRKSSGIIQGNPDLEKLISKIFEMYNWRKPQTIDEIKIFEEKINAEFKSVKYQPCLRIKTIRRLLKKEKYDKSFDISTTLNPLSRLCKYADWADFVKQESGKEYAFPEKIPERNESFYPADICIDAETLTPGSIFIMGWYPSRYIKIEYLGDCEFKIINYKGKGEDRTGSYITGRWFEFKYETATSKNGVQEKTPVIVGVLGDEIFDRVYL
jgi:hypothetical protein